MAGDQAAGAVDDDGAVFDPDLERADEVEDYTRRHPAPGGRRRRR